MEAKQPNKVAGRDIAFRWAAIGYVWWWTKRAWIRHLFDRWALGALIVSLVFVVAELIVELTGRSVAHSGSVALQVMFVVALGIAIYSKVREWREQHQQLAFVGAAERIVAILSAPHDGGEHTIQELLQIFRQTLKRTSWRSPIQLRLPSREQSAGHGWRWRLLNTEIYPVKPRVAWAPNICLTTCVGDSLAITRCQPETADYDREFKVQHGLGGAGYSCKYLCTTYIPWKFLRAGIMLTPGADPRGKPYDYDMLEDLYVPATKEPYESILSVPIVSFGRCFGALNFDSELRNSFRRLDFQQAMFFGYVVAQVLQKTSAEWHGTAASKDVLPAPKAGVPPLPEAPTPPSGGSDKPPEPVVALLQFLPGSKVRHPVFGVGTVVRSEGFGHDLKVTVSFAGLGSKKLVARYAALEPVL